MFETVSSFCAVNSVLYLGYSQMPNKHAEVTITDKDFQRWPILHSHLLSDFRCLNLAQYCKMELFWNVFRFCEIRSCHRVYWKCYLEKHKCRMGTKDGKDQVLKGHLGPVRSVRFSGDGHQLLTCADDKIAKVRPLFLHDKAFLH